MADDHGVWGIEIGQAGLKAIRLKYAESSGQVLAVAFDYIAHPKILSQPDAIPGELIDQALDKFLSRNKLVGDKVAISVPGQTSLIRFIQLPPVESSKVAEIVKYEARQQIPFALEEVCWQWQTLGSGSEEGGFMVDAEVGLFAMKRDQVMHQMNPFTDHQVEIDIVQCAPLALYNFLGYDILGMRTGEEFTASDEYTIILDMGTDNTSLLVTNGEKIWPRNVPIGGNHFTRALTKSMKLTFAKAEHLKCNATKSPDPRAVFQALRPVFNDYVSEIQRSIGYFSSVNRNAKIGRIVGAGNGFKLAGLQKFLQQNLQYEVVKLESFKSLVGDAVVKSPMFQDNILSFAVPYGLALQGLNLGKINVDLLPEEIRTERMIRRKKPWVLATAAGLLAGLALSMTGYAMVAKSVSDNRWGGSVKTATDTTAEANRLKTEYDKNKKVYTDQTDQNKRMVKPGEDRLLWLELGKAVEVCLPFDKSEQFKEYELNLKKRVKVELMTTQYVDDVKTWFEQIPTKLRDRYMGKIDRENPPEGKGFIVTLLCHHYHVEFEADEGRKPQSYGEIWANQNFVVNFRKWRIAHPGNDPVPVRELGITHPILAQYREDVDFQFDIDLTKLDKKTKEMFENDKKTSVDATRCEFTVQFVWQPPSNTKRSVFKHLYDYLKQTPEASFEDAKKYVDGKSGKDFKFSLEEADFKYFMKSHKDTLKVK